MASSGCPRTSAKLPALVVSDLTEKAGIGADEEWPRTNLDPNLFIDGEQAVSWSLLSILRALLGHGRRRARRAMMSHVHAHWRRRMVLRHGRYSRQQLMPMLIMECLRVRKRVRTSSEED